MTVDRWSRLIFQAFVFFSSLFFQQFFLPNREILSSELDF
jgi:hypothetical protein